MTGKKKYEKKCQEGRIGAVSKIGCGIPWRHFKALAYAPYIATLDKNIGMC